MKIIFRLFGIVLCFLLVVVILSRCINANIIENDLNNITAIAINQTQKELCQQKILSLKSESSTFKITDDESYQNYFKECFYSFLQEKYQKYYHIQECISDYEKGIISVSITSNAFPLVQIRKLTSIIEMPSSGICKIEESEEIEVYEQLKIPQGKRWNELLKNKVWPKELYVWQFDDVVRIDSVDIGINYCVSSALDDEYLYWYPGLRLVGVKEDGTRVVLAQKGENDCDGPRRLIGSLNEEVIEVILELISYQPDNGQESRINRLTTINNDSSHPYSYIGITKRETSSKGFSKECDESLIYYRFIDGRQQNLIENSVWLLEDYQNVLKEFTK